MAGATKGRIMCFPDKGEVHIEVLHGIANPHIEYMNTNHDKAMAYFQALSQLKRFDKLHDLKFRDRCILGAYKYRYKQEIGVEVTPEFLEFKGKIVELIDCVNEENIQNYNDELISKKPTAKTMRYPAEYWAKLRGELFESYTVEMHKREVGGIERGRDLFVMTSGFKLIPIENEHETKDIGKKTSVDFLINEEPRKIIGECKIGPDFIEPSIVSLLDRIKSTSCQIGDEYHVGIFCYTDYKHMEERLKHSNEFLKIPGSGIRLISQKEYWKNDIILDAV